MYKLFLHQKHIIVYDKSDKDFKAKYGHSYEQINFVKDQSSLSLIVSRMKKQYNADEVTYDCIVKRRSGWKYFTEEQKALARANLSKAHTGKKRDADHCRAISESRKGKRNNFAGKKHTDEAKNLISLKALGHKRVTGRKWCYDPNTGKEKRSIDLPKGFIWGRNPDLEIVKMFNVNE